MKIQIYGSGCDKCKQLYANTEKALRDAGLEADLEKVTDMNAIVEAGILLTPALAIDGKIVSKGKVPSPEEISVLLGVPGEKKSCCCCCCSGDCSGAKKTHWKRIFTVSLLVFAAASVGTMIYRESTASKPTESVAASPISEDVLYIYYFHGTKRCFTCNQIEALAKSAVERKYSDRMKDGSVVFRSINVDEPANEHFIKDFALDSKIVVMQKGGRVEKFPEVWPLSGDPEKFTSYIQNGMEVFLK